MEYEPKWWVLYHTFWRPLYAPPVSRLYAESISVQAPLGSVFHVAADYGWEIDGNFPYITEDEGTFRYHPLLPRGWQNLQGNKTLISWPIDRKVPWPMRDILEVPLYRYG